MLGPSMIGPPWLDPLMRMAEGSSLIYTTVIQENKLAEML